ncbi:hypothetical protein BASA61_004379 [Batrachochytrium salamandrivorans]|nr:hypothetical protein BASA61_004379 [Batrachochytrium salamandrivorans]KAJ1341204.1 hypothetical protein BSLG_004209 [Batrachochytrium salamandrivorans]
MTSLTADISAIPEAIIKQLALTGNVQLLTSYCQLHNNPVPAWTESDKKLDRQATTFDIAMVMEGHRFELCNSPSKIDGRKRVALAAVMHFTNAGVPFFQDHQHLGYITLLNLLCQAIGFKSPTFRCLLSGTKGGFLAIAHIHQEFESQTPFPTKQLAKEDVSRLALETMIRQPEIQRLFHTKCPSAYFCITPRKSWHLYTQDVAVSTVGSLELLDGLDRSDMSCSKRGSYLLSRPGKGDISIVPLKRRKMIHSEKETSLPNQNNAPIMSHD